MAREGTNQKEQKKRFEQKVAEETKVEMNLVLPQIDGAFFLRSRPDEEGFEQKVAKDAEAERIWGFAEDRWRIFLRSRPD